MTGGGRKPLQRDQGLSPCFVLRGREDIRRKMSQKKVDHDSYTGVQKCEKEVQRKKPVGEKCQKSIARIGKKQTYAGTGKGRNDRGDGMLKPWASNKYGWVALRQMGGDRTK